VIALIQRVAAASVAVGGETVGEIGAATAKPKLRVWPSACSVIGCSPMRRGR
jgi:hypothetical protein